MSDSSFYKFKIKEKFMTFKNLLKFQKQRIIYMIQTFISSKPKSDSYGSQIVGVSKLMSDFMGFKLL